MKYKRWTDQEKQFIAEACKTYTNAELGKAVGASGGAVSYQLLFMGINRGLKKWTAKEIKWVRANAHIGIVGLARHFHVANTQIIGMLKNHGIQTGNATRFVKGQVPANKGKRMETWLSAEQIAKIKQTSFKKGNRPHNTLYDGAIRTRNDNSGLAYQYIRLSKAKWELLHRHVWQQHYGPIPAGKVVAFKDGNQLNCKPENLTLLSLKENMQRNTIHRYPQEVVEVIKVVSKLKRKIKKYEKQD